ncbi:MAG: hypothetical protein IJ960_08530 [Oscillospiraceae bacterium]|nr:hypothetical protein [Oscillospiraceae bacterium]
MKKKGMIAALVLALVLTGCASDTVVNAVQVRMVTRAGEAPDYYAGVVVSENTVEVRRDLERVVAETCVSVGDVVEVDQVLFRYDSDELNLQLDRLELDMDRLEADIKSKEDQIKEVEKELKKATGDLKTQLNIQLRQLETDLTQAKYDKEDLTAEIEQTKKMLQNVEIKSTVDGTVRKIDSSSEIYITIQQTGAFQICGGLNELNLESGITEGAEVIVVSRLNPEQTWIGTVNHVDFHNTQSNSYDALYGSTDLLSGSTSYPFYVTLDSTEGLLLGQHVYIRLARVNELEQSRVLMPENYLMSVRYNEETLITSADVWCVDGEGKLTKREVVLGEYVMSQGCYVVLDGLAMDDYVADPSNPDCAEGVMTDVRSEEDFVIPTTEPWEDYSPESEPSAEPETETGAAQTTPEDVFNSGMED